MAETFDEMMNGSNTQQPAPPTPPVPAPKAVTDLSPRVIQLARTIDRLPPGEFEITIVKQDIRAMDWTVEVVDTLTNRPVEHLTISKYHPE